MIPVKCGKKVGFSVSYFEMCNFVNQSRLTAAYSPLALALASMAAHAPVHGLLD